MKKIVIILAIIFIILIGFIWFIFLGKNILPSKFTAEQNMSPFSGELSETMVIAKNLEIPWGIVFLPDKSMLVTERPGRVRLIDNNGNLQTEPVFVFNNVRAVGEGGLLGITIPPDFSVNNYVYLYYTYDENNGTNFNRVVRMTYQNKKLQDEKIIVDKIPSSSNHDGGRIKFGPDNFLYITTGDAENPSQAQDINALGGKILRVTDEGKPVPDNPFNNLVYSYGHRNPQGLAWNNNGELWETEHGRSGILSGLDEINLIEKGKNYGWPIIQGDQTKVGMVIPKLNSGFNTWAPAGAVFINNSLFFGGLRGSTLYEAVIDSDNKISLKEHFKNQFGRIRDVVLGPDNFLYITTSNRDGRGIPNLEDDKIIKINPNKLTMKITSPAFQDNILFPKKYACDGSNINPPIFINNIPQNSKSLALVLRDPDAPSGNFIHWLVWNINPDTTEIKENSIPIGSVQGSTGRGKPGYVGPCPPSGFHRYFLKIYSLDTILDLPSSANISDFEKSIQGHIIDQSEIMARYSKG